MAFASGYSDNFVPCLERHFYDNLAGHAILYSATF